MNSVGTQGQSPEQLRQDQLREGRKRTTLKLREDTSRRPRPSGQRPHSSKPKSSAPAKPKALSAQDKVLAEVKARNGFLEIVHGINPADDNGGLRFTVGRLTDFDRHCLVVDIQMSHGGRVPVVFYKHSIDWFFPVPDENGENFEKGILERANAEQGVQ